MYERVYVALVFLWTSVLKSEYTQKSRNYSGNILEGDIMLVIYEGEGSNNEAGIAKYS